MGTSQSEVASLNDNVVTDLTDIARQNYAQMAKGYHSCTNGKGVFLKLMYTMIEGVDEIADILELDGPEKIEIEFLKNSSKLVLDQASPDVSTSRLVKHTILLAENRYNSGFGDEQYSSLEDCPLQFPMLTKCEDGPILNKCKNYASIVIIKNMLESVQEKEIPRGFKGRYSGIMKKYDAQLEKCANCITSSY